MEILFCMLNNIIVAWLDIVLYILFCLFTCVLGIQIQDLMLAWQAFYHLSHFPSHPSKFLIANCVCWISIHACALTLDELWLTQYCPLREWPGRHGVPLTLHSPHLQKVAGTGRLVSQHCADEFYVNLTQVRAIWEKGTAVEKNVTIGFTCRQLCGILSWLMMDVRGSVPHEGGATSGQVVLNCRREPIGQGSKKHSVWPVFQFLPLGSSPYIPQRWTNL